MSAVKSGNHIYVEGTGNTLASVASDINDAAYCTWDAGSNTLTVFGSSSAVRYFRTRNGSELTINGGETLQFSNATNDDTRMYIDAGSHLIMNDDAEINGSLGSTRPSYWYIYGRVTCNADIPGGLRPTFKEYYRIYFYETANNNSYPNDIWDFTGAFFGGPRVNNGYAIYMYVVGKVRNHIFKDMLFDERLDSNLDAYGFGIIYGGEGYTNITFENIQFDQVERGFNITGGAIIRTKDCTIDRTSNSWGVLHYGNSVSSARDRLRAYGYHNEKPYGQYFSYHENFTFLSGNQNNKMNVSYGAQVLIKDCDWQRTTGDSIECKYRGRVLQWTGNTFADSSPFDIQQNGERSLVFRLQLTVLDEDGNPVEDAVVKIRQHEDKEQYTFSTGADGMMHAIHDLKGAMLTHRSYYSNTAYQTWSSASEPHRYEVYVDGYEVAHGTAVMDQDRTATINLTPTSSGTVEDFSQAPGIEL